MSITVQELYDSCSVLISQDDSTSNFIQVYDPFLLEDDFGNIVFEFESLDDELEVTSEGNILIDGTSYTPLYIVTGKQIGRAHV